MTDILERLRAGNLVLLPILAEAADEIERLRAELDLWKKSHEMYRQFYYDEERTRRALEEPKP